MLTTGNLTFTCVTIINSNTMPVVEISKSQHIRGQVCVTHAPYSMSDMQCDSEEDTYIVPAHYNNMDTLRSSHN